MASRTDIANLALSHIGESGQIANVDNDSSAVAKACRQWLDQAIQTVLRDFDWSFARRYFLFNKVADNPTLEYAFSYRVPADCLAFRKILTGIRRNIMQDSVPFMMGSDNSGGLILTDMPDMQGTYTALVTNTNLYPPDFVEAVSLKLAYLVVPRISAGDPYKRRPDLARDYVFSVNSARANSANEMQMDPEPEPLMLRVRGLGDRDHLDRPLEK